MRRCSEKLHCRPHASMRHANVAVPCHGFASLHIPTRVGRTYTAAAAESTNSSNEQVRCPDPVHCVAVPVEQHLHVLLFSSDLACLAAQQTDQKTPLQGCRLWRAAHQSRQASRGCSTVVLSRGYLRQTQPERTETLEQETRRGWSCEGLTEASGHNDVCEGAAVQVNHAQEASKRHKTPEAQSIKFRDRCAQRTPPDDRSLNCAGTTHQQSVTRSTGRVSMRASGRSKSICPDLACSGDPEARPQLRCQR